MYTYTHDRFIFNFLERSRRTGPVHLDLRDKLHEKFHCTPHEFLFSLSLPKENLSIRVSTKC